MNGKVYITYNSKNKNHIEESTALRLQTLSNLYGIAVHLPYRPELKFESDKESQDRILKSDYIIVFSMTGLSARLKEEIDYALREGKPIIIIYDNATKKRINIYDKVNIIELNLDSYNSEDTLKNVALFLQKKFKEKNLKLSNKPSPSHYSSKNKSNGNNEKVGLGIALLGIGLGMLALALLSYDEKG